MRAVLAVVAACSMVGCAQQPVGTPANLASDYQLCQAVILGNSHQSGQAPVIAEQQRRGLDCAPYAQAIVQQDAARRQHALQAYQILQANRPAPMPVYQIPPPTPSPSVNCTSTQYGNQVQTTCR